MRGERVTLDGRGSVEVIAGDRNAVCREILNGPGRMRTGTLGEYLSLTELMSAILYFLFGDSAG